MSINILRKNKIINNRVNNYHELNAMLNLHKQGKDSFYFNNIESQAIKLYFQQHIIPKTIFFNDIYNKLKYLINNGYYEEEIFKKYKLSFINTLFRKAHKIKFRFRTFLGVYKFYTSYALKTFDGKKYLESYEDRVCAVALTLANGNHQFAISVMKEILSRRFQPATPTFLNSAKKQRGELVSCFLLRIEDNMESIGRSINSALQLSKRGGGVAFSLTNIRETGSPIKKVKNQSSGIIPIMKLLEDAFSYANQLGARQGAGAVYINAHHPDIYRFLDTKRENADEKIRIKSLSLGVVIPDITFHLAQNNKNMYLFSPYDVKKVYGVAFSEIDISQRYSEMIHNLNIKKIKTNARKFFQTIAEIQFESGYPYLMFEDTVNRSNPIEGKITMSNLCTEILQISSPTKYNADLSCSNVGIDISCNLGSLNIASTMNSPNFEHTIDVAIRSLSSVSDMTNIKSVPSIEKGNKNSHAIGLGQMNLHGYLIKEKIYYGSEECIDFTNIYFYSVLFYCLKTSNKLAKEKGKSFVNFSNSKYATGEFFEKYTTKIWKPKTKKVSAIFKRQNINIPTQKEWTHLKHAIIKHGIYNQNLQAIPPTGSISYMNDSTASIHPIVSKIEIRKEGKLGRVYYRAPFLEGNNLAYCRDAYQINYKKIIDTYAAATQHVDQGLSLTLFFKDRITTRDLNKAQIYAWKKGIKTLYYIRLRQKNLEGTDIKEECVSCKI